MSGGRATGRWGIDPRRSLRWLGIATSLELWCCTVLLFVTVATVEWRIATERAAPGALGRGWVLLAFVPPGLASAALLTAVVGVLVRATRNQRDPLPVLAERARQIASGDRVQIPYQDRVDHVGDLARALREWQQAATVREVLLRSAPVGIFWLSATGHVLDVNQASLSILGYAKTELQGRFLLDLVHPDEQYMAAMASAEALTAAGHDRAEVEARLLRRDGSWLWCSAVAAPVTMEEGPPAGFIIIIEDIGERRREAAWAATVSSRLPPAVSTQSYRSPASSWARRQLPATS
jgi:PAS domain S-box-containing protein